MNAKYTSITKRKTGFAELLSFRYAIKAAEGKNKPTLYWECKECKKTFPMTNV